MFTKTQLSIYKMCSLVPASKLHSWFKWPVPASFFLQKNRVFLQTSSNHGFIHLRAFWPLKNQTDEKDCFYPAKVSLRDVENNCTCILRQRYLYTPSTFKSRFKLTYMTHKPHSRKKETASQQYIKCSSFKKITK